MKINHIFFVIKGQFPVTDYTPNTIILYFIVHCIYVLRVFYCITCLCLSLTPPVSGLRCVVFNKVRFCSVKDCSKICCKYVKEFSQESVCVSGGGGGEYYDIFIYT